MWRRICSSFLENIAFLHVTCLQWRPVCRNDVTRIIVIDVFRSRVDQVPRVSLGCQDQ